MEREGERWKRDGERWREMERGRRGQGREQMRARRSDRKTNETRGERTVTDDGKREEREGERRREREGERERGREREKERKTEREREREKRDRCRTLKTDLTDQTDIRQTDRLPDRPDRHT
jgi:hypothetical protein